MYVTSVDAGLAHRSAAYRYVASSKRLNYGTLSRAGVSNEVLAQVATIGRLAVFREAAPEARALLQAALRRAEYEFMAAGQMVGAPGSIFAAARTMHSHVHIVACMHRLARVCVAACMHHATMCTGRDSRVSRVLPSTLLERHTFLIYIRCSPPLTMLYHCATLSIATTIEPVIPQRHAEATHN